MACGLALFVVAAAATCCVAAPAPSLDADKAMIYLSQYGYMNASMRKFSSSYLTLEEMTRAIMDFQAFAGLNITGELDEDTKNVMSLPRCGVRDRVGTGAERSKRYALQGSRWRVKSLTYRISKYPSNLSKSKVDKELKKAFEVWSKYTDLDFKQMTSGSVHIDIRFEKGEHGDGDPFDGPGGTLAHAYFPVYGGDAHFDDAERWTIDSYRGTNLFQVAAHEFGHSLGLSHSDVKTALMAPFYRGYESSFSLDVDDVEAIQALYGKKSRGVASSTTTTKPIAQPPTVTDKNLCKHPSFDTIFHSADNEHFVFKGDDYWKLTATGIAAGYPKKIANGWPGLPGDIDAAFTYRNGKTYFFKGSQYWRYIGNKMDGDYPKLISSGFTGIPDNVDAALVWSGNGKIYFFKGSKFWKFDPSQKPPVQTTYPKPISNWEGIPNNLNAATVYQGYTYFFKDGDYYRFDDRGFKVDVGDPSFPRPTAKWWFGCKGEYVQADNSVEDEPTLHSEIGEDVLETDSTYERLLPPKD